MPMSGNQKSIYTLSCPIEKKVRYVGLTWDLKQRYLAHIQSPSPTTKQWIMDLKSKNLLPIITEIEKTHWCQAFKVEKVWINHFENTVGGLLNKRSNDKNKKQ